MSYDLLEANVFFLSKDVGAISKPNFSDTAVEEMSVVVYFTLYFDFSIFLH